MKPETQKTLHSAVDGWVDELIFTFGFTKHKAVKEMCNALQEPLIKSRILAFVLMGNETTTAAGSSCSGVSNRLCQ